MIPLDTNVILALMRAKADCQIAAIARAKDAPIATRNVKDFDDCGVRVINPWNDQ